MNLDSFLPPIEGIWDVSILILLMGVMLFYFGKLICSVKIWEFEKSDYYLQGFTFFLAYLAIPFVGVLLFYRFFDWVIPFGLSLLICMIISGLLGIGVLYNVGKFRLFTKLKPKFEEKIKEQHPEKLVENVNKKFGTKLNWTPQELSNTFLEAFEMGTNITSKKYVLFLFSYALIWVTLSTYNLYQISLESLTIFLFVLTIYTLMPVQFGYSDLIKPFVRIVLDDGTEHKGILQKMGKFVVVTKEDEEKNVSINSNKIKIIEGKMVNEKT